MTQRLGAWVGIQAVTPRQVHYGRAVLHTAWPFFFYQQWINKIKEDTSGVSQPIYSTQKWTSYKIHKRNSSLWLEQNNLKVRAPYPKKTNIGDHRLHNCEVWVLVSLRRAYWMFKSQLNRRAITPKVYKVDNTHNQGTFWHFLQNTLRFH